MKRWELARLIQAANISDRAKVVGMVIASHWSPTRDAARLRLATIAAEVGKANRTVIRAVNELIGAQIFVRVRTGRASVLRLGRVGQNSSALTYSGSDTFDTSEWAKKPPKPKTGTRFKEFCERLDSTEDSGERYTKDQEFYLGF